MKNDSRKKLLIMKLGGSLITHKNRWYPSINEENLKRLSKEIKRGLESRKDLSLILIHGAGSYGHVLAKIYKAMEENDYSKKLMGFAEIQKLQNILNAKVCDFLLDEDIPAVPMQASFSAVLENGKLKKMDIEAIKGMVEVGLVPVLYGVPAYDEKKKGNILSGDTILVYLTEKLSEFFEIESVVHITNVDGVFDRNPEESNAKLIERIDKNNIDIILNVVSKSNNIDVTGGMWKKVSTLSRLKNVKCIIANGNREGVVEKIILGEKVISTEIFID